MRGLSRSPESAIASSVLRMSTMPEPGRLTAHVLLDAVSAYNDGRGTEANRETLHFALAALNDTDAVVMRDGDLDISDLIGPAISLVHAAVEIAVRAGVDRDLVILELREHIDQN